MCHVRDVSSFDMHIREVVFIVLFRRCNVGLFKGDQASAEYYQNMLDPLLKDSNDGQLVFLSVCRCK